MRIIRQLVNIRHITGILGLSFILTMPVALAADIEAGVAAYNAGNYDRAA